MFAWSFDSSCSRCCKRMRAHSCTLRSTREQTSSTPAGCPCTVTMASSTVGRSSRVHTSASCAVLWPFRGARAMRSNPSDWPLCQSSLCSLKNRAASSCERPHTAEITSSTATTPRVSRAIQPTLTVSFTPFTFFTVKTCTSIGADFWFESARFGETGCVARFATRDIFFRLHGLLCQSISFTNKSQEFQHRKLNTESSRSTISNADD